MNEWFCKKAYVIDGYRCSHSECRATPEERGSTLAHGMRPKDDAALSVPDAAEFLAQAAERIDGLNRAIADNDAEQKELAKLQIKMREEIAELTRKADNAIGVIAASFGHTYAYTNEPEENHG